LGRGPNPWLVPAGWRRNPPARGTRSCGGAPGDRIPQKRCRSLPRLPLNCDLLYLVSILKAFFFSPPEKNELQNTTSAERARAGREQRRAWPGKSPLPAATLGIININFTKSGRLARASWLRPTSTRSARRSAPSL